MSSRHAGKTPSPLTPDKNRSPGDIEKIFEEKENLITTETYNAKKQQQQRSTDPGSSASPTGSGGSTCHHPLGQSGEAITPPDAARDANVLKNSSARNSLNNDDDVTNSEGNRQEDTTPVPAPRSSGGSLKNTDSRQSVVRVENF